MTMTEKLKELFNSIGFWLATLGTLLQILRVLFPQYTEIWNILTAYVGAVFVRGATDSFATKMGEGKKSAITVTDTDKVVSVEGDVQGDIK